MNLTLNLATPRQSPAWLGWLLLAVGLASAGWAGWHHVTVQAELERQQARVARFTPKAAKPKPAKQDKAKESPLLVKARDLLSADWSMLLAALEQARPDGVALLALDAEAGGGMVSLTAEAKDHATMLAYVKTLEGRAGLGQVALASHMDVERAGEKAVNFVVRARWRGV